MQIQTNSGMITIPVEEIEAITFSQVSAENMELLIQKIPITLLKNYPNPFNPKTKILFEITEPGIVEIGIYNIKGQKVIQLLEKELDIGQHAVFWEGLDGNGKKVSSGVYLYKVSVNQKEKIKKMMMLK
jgi:hypothetical protein